MARWRFALQQFNTQAQAPQTSGMAHLGLERKSLRQTNGGKWRCHHLQGDPQIKQGGQEHVARHARRSIDIGPSGLRRHLQRAAPRVASG